MVVVVVVVVVVAVVVVVGLLLRHAGLHWSGLPCSSFVRVQYKTTSAIFSKPNILITLLRYAKTLVLLIY